ncbi:hypothetical protein FSP39_011266, partial [Pinctada imbricata]
KQKESSVLKDSSLAVLSRELGPEKYNGLVLGMLLNIPTITLVRIANDASECGLKDASDKTKVDATQTILFKWRELRAGTKEREKVKELTRAIKEMGKEACAQMIAEKNIENVELTADAFAALA